VLVTGANGFVGRAVSKEFLKRGMAVWAGVRDNARAVAMGAEPYVLGDLGLAEKRHLPSVDAIVHLAGIAHELRGQNAEHVYQTVNCAATERLARDASMAGIRRFVFVSTIKVNGERTAIDRPFRETDTPAPHDRYARSKLAAEQALARVAAETGLEVVVIRPPLVYGPGVRANFRRLVDLVKKGLPLPLGSIRNRRSLIYVGNLADALALSIAVNEAKGNTFLVSDGRDLSTPELVRRIAAALGRGVKLFPFPPGLLPAKLVESLVVDSSAVRAALGWRPPYEIDAALVEALR
jgi:nucleoside-diphosphate-sugar epimerase